MKAKIKRPLMWLLIVTFLFQTTDSIYAEPSSYAPSSWATQKITIASQLGLLPETFVAQPFTNDITRLDFCELLLKSCEIMNIEIPSAPEIPTFTDTSSFTAQAAYLLGFTQGTSTRIFSPDLPLTREMAAVMLSRLRILFQSNGVSDQTWFQWDSHNNNGGYYVTTSGAIGYTLPMESDYASRILSKYAQDSTSISTWATISMADVFTRGILQGTGNGNLSPQKNLTREQAAILVFNVMTYCDVVRLQALGITDCLLPAPVGIYMNDQYYRGDVYLEWTEVPQAIAYDISLYNEGLLVYSTRLYDTFLDLRTTSSTYNRDLKAFEVTVLDNPLFTYIFGTEQKVIHSQLEVTPVNSNGTPSLFTMKQAFTIDAWTNRNEKVFGDPTKTSFANDAEARQHMTSIKVYVWKMIASGEKKPATVTLTVNKNVAEDLKKVFDLIYNGSEKFPINGCGAYAFGTGRSEHSFGTAIDINPNENYFVTWEGVPKVGSFWQPGISPFSIPSGGDVVRAFNQVGWHWSPDMHWSNGADYMHFSLTGN